MRDSLLLKFWNIHHTLEIEKTEGKVSQCGKGMGLQGADIQRRPCPMKVNDMDQLLKELSGRSPRQFICLP